jgi:hypothetical protein
VIGLKDGIWALILRVVYPYASLVGALVVECENFFSASIGRIGGLPPPAPLGAAKQLDSYLPPD